MFSKLVFALCSMIIALTATAQSQWPQRGTFSIAARANRNQVLAVEGGRNTQGWRIVLASSQSVPKGAGVWSYQFDNMLINQRSGLALTVFKPNAAGSASPGTILVQQGVNASSSEMVQLWNYFAGSGQIHPAFAGDLCVTAGKQSLGGVATVEGCVSGSPAQSWTVVVLPA